MARLASDLKTKAEEKRAPLADLLRELRPRAEMARTQSIAPRFETIRSAQALVGDLLDAPNALATVEALASATLETSEAALSRLLGSV
jgi:hypothetical protein